MDPYNSSSFQLWARNKPCIIDRLNWQRQYISRALVSNSTTLEVLLETLVGVGTMGLSTMGWKDQNTYTICSSQMYTLRPVVNLSSHRGQIMIYDLMWWEIVEEDFPCLWSHYRVVQGQLLLVGLDTHVCNLKQSYGAQFRKEWPGQTGEPIWTPQFHARPALLEACF